MLIGTSRDWKNEIARQVFVALTFTVVLVGVVLTYLWST
jgi:hypothetical protein